MGEFNWIEKHEFGRGESRIMVIKIGIVIRGE